MSRPLRAPGAYLRSADAPRQAAARDLALKLGRGEGISSAAVERRLRREPGSAVYDEQRLARCETIPKPPAG